MIRAFAFLSVFAALMVGAVLWAGSARDAGPTAPDLARAQGQATQAALDASLVAARVGAETRFAEIGSYAGAPPAGGVVMVTADSSSYCLQAGIGDNVRHLWGPGGLPASGPC